MVRAKEASEIHGLPLHKYIVHDTSYGLNRTSTLDTCLAPGKRPLLS